MELREGYMLRVPNQTGGGAAYSLTPYTISVPDSYLDPPPPNAAYSPITGYPPPISQVLPNGTRTALYWQTGIPSQAITGVVRVTCSIQAAGVPELAIYNVQSTARFAVGRSVIVEGVTSDSGTPAGFFDGTFPIQAIGAGTITLDLGISTRKKRVSSLLPPPVQPPRFWAAPRLPFYFSYTPPTVAFGYVSANTIQNVEVTLTFEDPQNTGAVGQFLGASLGTSIFYLSPVSPQSLTAGQSYSFSVYINQPTPGLYTDTLAIDTNLGFIYLQVTATVTNFSVQPTTLNFGSMAANIVASLFTTITYNDPTGGSTGTISSISLSDPTNTFTLQSPPGTPINLSNGQSVSLQVNAFQAVAGTYTAPLTIVTNLGTYTVTVTATIVAAAGNIVVNPLQLSFGNQPVGEAATPSTFVITNNSGVAVNLSGPVVANPAFYMVNPPTFPYSLANGSSLTITIGVTPAKVGPDQGYITINTDSLSFVQVMVQFYVIGTSTAPGTVTVVPTSLDFGSVAVGSPVSPQSIVITNNYGTAVALNSASMSNPDFVLQNSPLPFILANGASVTLTVGGTPSTSGRDSGILTINTDAANYAQLTIPLEVNGSGTGTGYPKNYSGTGGTITAVDMTPGPPEPLLLPLTTAGDIVFLPGTFPIKGMPIVSTAPWHYAEGKDGYLYMHNGSDAKFFDGVVFRDIGLPILTAQQASQIRVASGFSAPPDGAINSATITWTAGGTFFSSTSYNFYCAFFDTATNQVAPSGTPLSGGPSSPTQDSSGVQLSGLPVPPDPTNVKLIGVNNGTGGGGSFLTVNAENPSAVQTFNGSMSASGDMVTVNTNIANNSYLPHGLASGDVVAIDEPNEIMGAWPSSGPFAVSVTGPYTFSFKLPSGADPSAYNLEVTFGHLLALPAATTSVTLFEPATLSYQGTSQSSNGVLQLPYIEAIAAQLLPASTIGGAQPGYQFYASIYNVITGHVGNRVPIGVRLRNTGNATVNITGLPNFTLPSTEIQYSQLQGKIPTILLPTSDPEWRILIGRTGDGGEVPYACIDSKGNWIVTTSPSQSVLDATSGEVDSNSELPFNNYPPPRSHVTPATQESFANFWREGDRMCGTLKDSPFVYRSASELDSTTGIFVGDPAQAWDPSKIETFPSTQPVIGGFGNMQESWVYTRDELAQLSELSGQVSWNGPYNNFGIIGPFAFDNGWMALPFWVSHSRELCTMIPDGNGPIVISTEYERGLLSRIGDEFDAQGNLLGYMDKTQVVYFRDPTRMLEVLRIKCVDNNGKIFTVIHDFNLRDDASPYGQGYEEDFLGPLSIDYQHVYIRDSMALPRVWAAAADGQIYQFYTGGLDNVDYYDGTIGDAFTADAIALRYMGGERTVARTLEWYGDDKILWYIFENLLNVVPDQNYWVNLTFDMRPFPGDAQAAHYIADLQRPEMIHCYLWAQLTAHPVDAPIALDPMALSTPVPHVPLEQYGRLYLTAPWLGGSRGR